MKLTDEQAAEAPAIVKRWLQGKCREITQYKNSDARAYKTAKQSTLVKQQFTRWRKKELAHGLDQMMSKTGQQSHPTPGPSNTSAPAKKRGRSPNNPGAPVVSGGGSMNVD
ncbi:hypothetical protein VP01_1375g3 [Puccinia sorghi]|uniref:Uncharacterized protein n=1 Tax=Puccinia sorghi TaxID=27349 RepID=A0A0L6VLQ9_9BASI|nr:hypothetical protein VP01_1375g3 [Puccinia sorghi]